jgi:hypothetical protein
MNVARGGATLPLGSAGNALLKASEQATAQSPPRRTASERKKAALDRCDQAIHEKVNDTSVSELFRADSVLRPFLSTSIR